MTTIFRFFPRPLVSAAVAVAVALPALAEVPGIRDRPDLADLAERWEGAVTSLDVPGFTVAVVKDGELYALDAFGDRNVAGDPANPDTMYYIASCTKTYTGLAISQLADEGRLNLDAPVRTYLPQFKLPDEELAASITVRDLLCHRYGINSSPIVWQDAYTGQITDDAFFRLLGQASVAGSVSYSNVHFTILGRVIQAVSGKTWQDYLRDEVFAPGGMDRTTAYASLMYGDDNHAEPMIKYDGVWERAPQVKSDRVMHAAGGLGTTARDAGKWIVTHLNEGKAGNGTQLVSSGSMAKILTMQEKFDQTNGSIRAMEGFALAWQAGTWRSLTPYYQHGGGYIGTTAIIAYLPEKNIGVAVLTNVSSPRQALTTIISIDVIDRLLEVDLTNEQDLLPPYSRGVGQIVAQQKGFDASQPNPVEGDGLSLAASAYVGTYAHDDWGVTEVFLEDGKLVGRFGDLLMHFAAGESADDFTGWISPNILQTGGFDVDGHNVKGLTMDMSPGTEDYFTKEK